MPQGAQLDVEDYNTICVYVKRCIPLSDISFEVNKLIDTVKKVLY